MIRPNQSYAFITKSDFVFNLLMGYLYTLSEPEGIYKTKAIFGKYIEISDTATPSKNKIVVSRKERAGEEFETIDISKSFVSIFAKMLEVENKEYLAFCKKYIKKSKLELAYYYMAAIAHSCIEEESFLETKATTILNTYSYRGIHSLTDKYDSLITFISYPTEANLSELFLTFNEETGGFESLVSIISILAEEERIPEYIIQSYNEELNNQRFVRGLLLICTAMLGTSSKDEFILYCLNNIIKKG